MTHKSKSQKKKKSKKRTQKKIKGGLDLFNFKVRMEREYILANNYTKEETNEIIDNFRKLMLYELKYKNIQKTSFIHQSGFYLNYEYLKSKPKKKLSKKKLLLPKSNISIINNEVTQVAGVDEVEEDYINFVNSITNKKLLEKVNKYLGINKMINQDDRRIIYTIITNNNINNINVTDNYITKITPIIIKKNGYDVEILTYKNLSNSNIDLIKNNTVQFITEKTNITNSDFNITINNNITYFNLNKWNFYNKNLSYRCLITQKYIGYNDLDSRLTNYENLNIKDEEKIKKIETIYKKIINIIHLAFVEHNFIHGDLHTGNVLINENLDNIKLFDFDYSTIKHNNILYVSNSQINFSNTYYPKLYPMINELGFLFDSSRLLIGLTNINNQIFTRKNINKIKLPKIYNLLTIIKFDLYKDTNNTDNLYNWILYDIIFSNKYIFDALIIIDHNNKILYDKYLFEYNLKICYNEMIEFIK